MESAQETFSINLSSRFSRRRVAFIIGNNEYPTAPLRNAVNDALAVSESLDAIGFEVHCFKNLTAQQTDDVIKSVFSKIDKNPSETCLFYYSGHGMQWKDENFLLPIDILHSDDIASKLIRVKDIIEGLKQRSATRLIFLDACRDNPFADKIVKKVDLVDGMVRTRSAKKGFGGTVFDSSDFTGLTDIDVPTGTLIAYAAAPGKTATDDGPGNLSAFTQALVDHIPSVDLPLTNVLHNVNREVARFTNGAQQTWYHSSLPAPFFFNPGSLILLTGNMLSLLALISAIVIYTTTTIDGLNISLLSLGAAIIAFTIGILIYGMQRAFKRLRGNPEPDDLQPKGFFLNLLRRGGIGGILGALVATPFVALPFYWRHVEEIETFRENCGRIWNCSPDIPLTPEPIGLLTIEMAIAGGFACAALGILCFFGASVYFDQGKLKAVSHPTRKHLIIGSIAGGILAGLLVGPPITGYFSFKSRPIAGPEFLAPGAVIGSAFVAFALVNYNLDRMSLAHLWRTVLAAFGGVIGGGAVAFLVFGPLKYFGIEKYVKDYMTDEYSLSAFLLGGLAYGFFLGIVLGSVFAFTRYFTPGEIAEDNKARTTTLWPLPRTDDDLLP